MAEQFEHKLPHNYMNEEIRTLTARKFLNFELLLDALIACQDNAGPVSISVILQGCVIG